MSASKAIFQLNQLLLATHTPYKHPSIYGPNMSIIIGHHVYMVPYLHFFHLKSYLQFIYASIILVGLKCLSSSSCMVGVANIYIYIFSAQFMNRICSGELYLLLSVSSVNHFNLVAYEHNLKDSSST